MQILIASNNAHKAAELSAILNDIPGVEFLTLRDLADPPAEPVEDGATLEENAYIKAVETFSATGIPTIADDTGLEVPALGGEPGVRSARYAGADATYMDNCRHLLQQLEQAGSADRSARFRTVLCYADQFGTILAEGSVDGAIESEYRGEGGFGYDPLFVPAGDARTFAEMTPDQKNAVSHRARAIAAMRALLANHISIAQAGEVEVR